MSSKIVIEGKNIVREYRLGEETVQALRGVDFSIKEGEMVAIMGPSGSGKSTLMNLIGCLDRPTSGKLFLGGADIGELGDSQLAGIRNNKIGFVFQQFHLLPTLNLIQNVATPLLYAGIPLRRRNLMSREILESLGLEDRLYHKPNQLSGGQRQRAALARALVNQAPVILADEPTGALDSVTEENVMSHFKSIHSRGRTVVIITHDDTVARHCSRIIRIRDGRIEE